MPRKRKDTGVTIEGTASEPVSIQVAVDPMSKRDRVAVDLLMEIVASRGTVSPTFANSAVQSADELAKALGWE